MECPCGETMESHVHNQTFHLWCPECSYGIMGIRGGEWNEYGIPYCSKHNAEMAFYDKESCWKCPFCRGNFDMG